MTFAVAANEKGEKVLTMSKEYIERQRAIVDACNSLELYPSEYAKLEDALNRIPAADVVEAVRCKDCLYSRERYGHLECIHGVSYRNTWNKPDFFCAYGERTEGADNES